MAFFSSKDETCLPDNATNVSNLIFDYDYEDSPTDSQCDTDPEASTPLGYVVSCLQKIQSICTQIFGGCFYNKAQLCSPATGCLSSNLRHL